MLIFRSLVCIPSTKKVGEDGSLLERTQIPLSALPQSGKFGLIIRVTDEITGASTSRKLNFTELKSHPHKKEKREFEIK